MRRLTVLFSLVLSSCVTLPVLSEDKDADAKETVEVSVKDLTLKIPKSWKQEEPSSRFRFTQFSVSSDNKKLDSAEYAVFPPLGGSIEQNIERWVSQFQSTGRTAKMFQGTSQNGKYVRVDLSGTYNKPDGPPVFGRTKPAPEYGMLGVIITTAQGNYFIKFVGPREIIKTHHDAFQESFGADLDSEKPYEL